VGGGGGRRKLPIHSVHKAEERRQPDRIEEVATVGVQGRKGERGKP